MRRAFVVGAGGAVGESVARHLLERGWSVVASMHTKRVDVAERLRQAGASIADHDIDHNSDWASAAADSDVWIFTTHLTRTVRALSRVDRISRRVIALSSNNVAIQPEAAAYREIADAEHALRRCAPHATIVRPTMIYGDRRLPTVTRLLKLARRSPFLPLPGSGRARIQPIFFEDLGRLTAGLADQDAADGVYAAGGPDVLSMRDLFVAIVRAADGNAFVLPTPKLLVWFAALAPYSGFSMAQANRSEFDRTAVTQMNLPTELMPRTTISDGLRAHVASMRGDAH